MTYLQLSLLYPPDKSGQALKGRISAKTSLSEFATITPLEGLFAEQAGAGGDQIRQ